MSFHFKNQRFQNVLQKKLPAMQSMVAELWEYVVSKLTFRLQFEISVTEL